MKKTTLLLLSAFIGLSSYAQSKFQKGNIIDNTGKRINCLIKNEDWKDNPSSFKYKIGENTPVLTGNIASVKEFSINGKAKFQSYTVGIDRSSKREKELSSKRTPEFKNEALFLKVLVEGKTANLYSYTDGNLVRYFYSTPSEKITQLVYKYYRSSKGKVSKNELYKKQLIDKLSCSVITDIPSYTKKSLSKYFIALNKCNGTDNSLKDFTLNESKGKLRLKVKGGITFSKVKAKDLNVVFGPDTFQDDGIKVNPRFGIEIQYLFPFNNNRWGAFAEPSYQSFKGEASLFFESNGTVLTSNQILVDYKSIEVPLGLIHYFSTDTSNSLFATAGVILDFPMNSTINNNEIVTNTNVFFGIGYEFEKLSLEARYNTSRSLNDFPGLETNYNGFLLNLGYILF